MWEEIKSRADDGRESEEAAESVEDGLHPSEVLLVLRIWKQEKGSGLEYKVQRQIPVN